MVPNGAPKVSKVFHNVEASLHGSSDPSGLFATSSEELRNAAWSPDSHWILFWKVVHHVPLRNRVFQVFSFTYDRSYTTQTGDRTGEPQMPNSYGDSAGSNLPTTKMSSQSRADSWGILPPSPWAPSFLNRICSSPVFSLDDPCTPQLLSLSVCLCLSPFTSNHVIPSNVKALPALIFKVGTALAYTFCPLISFKTWNKKESPSREKKTMPIWTNFKLK